MEPAPELTPVETRVLGALIEKDMATPDYYPLSLNALTNACNQKTNREPVVDYSDATVTEGLEGLRSKSLAVFVHESGSRVAKYRHRMGEAFNFTRGELAVMGVLMLRGPQTTAELRDRTARLHPFEDASQVEQTLNRLAERGENGLVKLLPKLSGMKEPRWAQLLSGEPDWSEESASAASAPQPRAELQAAHDALAARVECLEIELTRLRAEFDALRAQLE